MTITDLNRLIDDFKNNNESLKTSVTLTTIFGAVVLLLIFFRLLYKSIVGFRLYILSQLSCCQVNVVEKYGRWAVISGATDGIGLAMAKDLARRGMSIVVIGRNQEKLERTKSMLETEHQVEVVTVRIDLSDSSPDNFESVKSQINPDNRDIGILINNAGYLSPMYRRVNRFSNETARTIVNTNILAAIYLTQMIMPAMVERGKGLLINVSSLLGTIPAVGMGFYGPSKSCINAYSELLQTEYSNHPVDVVNLTPGMVHTKLLGSASNLDEPNLICPSADQYAKSAINAIVNTRISSISGCFVHAAQHEMFKICNPLGLSHRMLSAHINGRGKDTQISPPPKRRCF